MLEEQMETSAVVADAENTLDTAAENDAQTPRFNSAKEVIHFLAEQFPQCFFVEGDLKPLKVGLFQELAEALANEPRVSKTQLRQALRVYTSSWRYLSACVADAERVGLQGENAGTVDAQQAEHAAAALQEGRERLLEKRKAERAQQRKERAPKAKFAKKPRQAKPNHKATSAQASQDALQALANKFKKG